MEILKIKNFYGFLLEQRKGMQPLSGQLELTYRCNLNCIHCYLGEHCGFQFSAEKKELSLRDWQKIIGQLHREGCLMLTLTGGEPLLRRDFFSIYEYAKQKGFLINIFTNGLLLDDISIDLLKRLSPHSIEMTLNGISKRTYESVTRIPGSFEKAMEVIKKLAKAKLPLSLKVNGLKQNKHEITKIKTFTEKLLGKNKFKFDSSILPRWKRPGVTGDFSPDPTKLRLSPKEIREIEEKDPDMRLLRQESLNSGPNLKRLPEYLYHCNSWQSHFFINPYGRLRFCCISEKYSTDLTEHSFSHGFYKEFPRIYKERFRFNRREASECIYCNLRSLCQNCPAKAFLETGDEERQVSYYCEIAKMMAQRKRDFINSR